MFSDPVSWFKQLAIALVPMLVAITFHEVAHGYAAYLLGDPTAKRAGRLTLNPIKHLDPLGALAFVLTRIIGWAKPVPIDPRFFANPRSGMMLVSLAGPAANFALAVASALVLGGLDTLHQFVPPPWSASVVVPLAYMSVASIQVNLALGLFNLLPIPPLDGGHILAGLLPPRAGYELERLAPFGFFIVLALAVTGLLGGLIGPAMDSLYHLLLQIAELL
ncbi:site-2 protease family protein [Fundidesulfovibrio butyratiphilus]